MVGINIQKPLEKGDYRCGFLACVRGSKRLFTHNQLLFLPKSLLYKKFVSNVATYRSLFHIERFGFGFGSVVVRFIVTQSFDFRRFQQVRKSLINCVKQG